MIKVFGTTDTVFVSNGDRIIQPLKAIVYREDNGDYYLELETSLEYAEILIQDKIVVVPTPWGDQAFRLNNPERTALRLIFRAKHIFFDAQNYILADIAPTNKDGQGALDWILERTDQPSPFTCTSDISDSKSTRFVRKTLLESIFELTELYNGHIDPDNYKITLNSTIGLDRGVTVSYGKNLTDIKAVENWDAVVTKILPVGYNGTVLPELYLYADLSFEKPYTKVLEFQPTEGIDKEDPDAVMADLRTQATAYLEANQYPKVNYSVSAHLEGVVGIGDIINVKHERLGIDILTSVISVRYNCLTSRFEAIEFGNFRNSIKGLIKNINTAIATVERSQASQYTQLNNALAISQTTIMEYLTVGHKYVTENAIYFMDTADPATAQKFMILSLGGIGFGANGIDGGYTTAWTLDGAFNADFITAGSLAANRITISGGTLPEKLTEIESNVTYKVEIISSGGMVCSSDTWVSTLTATVYQGKNDVTAALDASRFKWTRTSRDAAGDEAWNIAHFGGTKSIQISHADAVLKSTFKCEIFEEE
ncbi:MAG: phage tail spike protein [Saccharofermentanales bacterium]